MNRALFLALLLLSSAAHAQRLLVPTDYPTIQSAIDAAVDGDTVLIAPGTYVENIRFNGKAIVVASHFALNHDPAFIGNTVIDGSQPAEPDTASVVLFINGEGPDSVLEGFTLTGGTGTAWLDEHGAGRYVEGGGILAALSSPTIRFNIITGNSAARRPAGVQSAGGGGIRAGDGAATIENNVIVGNRAMYGGGIVSNYASTVIRNNVIAHNEVYQAVRTAPTFGGGGVWANGTGHTVVENNTIVANASSGGPSTLEWAGRAGGVLASEAMQLTARNNIVWGNTQSRDGQIYEVGGAISTAYNDIEGGFTSTSSGTHVGDIDADPVFSSDSFLLLPGSPAVDAGHPDMAYNDPEDPMSPGQAAAPAQGSVRNDQGAFGGPGAQVIGTVAVASEPGPSRPALALSLYPNPTSSQVTVTFTLARPGAGRVTVYDIRGVAVRTLDTPRGAAGPHTVRWDGRDEHGRRVASGVYLVRLQIDDASATQRLVLLR